MRHASPKLGLNQGIGRANLPSWLKGRFNQPPFAQSLFNKVAQALQSLLSKERRKYEIALPANEEAAVRFKIGSDASTIVIMGSTGTGKSVLAMLLAKQGLQVGVPKLVCLSRQMESLPSAGDIAKGPPDEILFKKDAARWLLMKLRDKYPTKVHFHHLAPDCSPVEIISDAEPGSMVIMDDISDRGRSLPSTRHWSKLAAERGVILVLTCQHPLDLFAASSVDDEGIAMEHIGPVFVGRLPSFDLAQTYPFLRDACQASRGLNYGVHAREFVVLVPRARWNGLVRLSLDEVDAP